MNSQVELSRSGESTRKPSGPSTGRVLLACAGMALLAPLALAGGRSSWGVSVGVASGGTFVGGSYSSGFYGGRGYGGSGWAGRGWGGPGYCAPVARPYCAPIARPYCAPVVRPYCGPSYYSRPYYYSGYRPYCPPVVAPCVPAYLPPVVVAPNTYLVDRPAVSVGVGVAGSSGAGYFSYASAPVVTTAVTEQVYAAPVVQPVVYSSPSQVVTFVNPNPTTVIQTAPQQAPQPAPVMQQSQQAPTIFQSAGASGAMDRGQTATSIVSIVKAEQGDARANAAESFLGKTPAQAWAVVFEGVQEVGGAKEIRCRPIDSLSSGYKPTIIVRGAGDSNTPPRQSRGYVTGRLSAISVDDPAYPGGLLVIDDGWLKW
ncbi:MAG: hypothetical protein KF691_02570 [Phycisphaeraceae bacterium]|nr:hypothetical protein [Phycisphaeraceae bacterium]